MKKLRIPGGGDGLLVLQTQLKHGNFRDDEGCEASFTQHRSQSIGVTVVTYRTGAGHRHTCSKQD